MVIRRGCLGGALACLGVQACRRIAASVVRTRRIVWVLLVEIGSGEVKVADWPMAGGGYREEHPYGGAVGHESCSFVWIEVHVGAHAVAAEGSAGFVLGDRTIEFAFVAVGCFEGYERCPLWDWFGWDASDHISLVVGAELAVVGFLPFCCLRASASFLERAWWRCAGCDGSKNGCRIVGDTSLQNGCTGVCCFVVRYKVCCKSCMVCLRLQLLHHDELRRCSVQITDWYAQ